MCQLKNKSGKPQTNQNYRIELTRFLGHLIFDIKKSIDVSPKTGRFKTTGGPLRWFDLTSF